MTALTIPIGELVAIVKIWLLQMIDNGWRCCESKSTRLYHTKTSQIYRFIDIYCGPEYSIFIKLASLLNITFVTMMYGLGLPLLFPTALVTLFVTYATERYQIAYTY